MSQDIVNKLNTMVDAYDWNNDVVTTIFEARDEIVSLRATASEQDNEFSMMQDENAAWETDLEEMTLRTDAIKVILNGSDWDEDKLAAIVKVMS